MSQTIIGLGGLLGDAACCVVKNGQMAAAVEQNKLSRRERRDGFPDEAFAAALETSGIVPAEIDCVAIARPLAQGAESATLLELRSRFPNSEIVVVDHHTAHAASAYYASGFSRARVLSVDRAGDFRSAAVFDAVGNTLTVARELYYPDSLGDLYNRVTELLGFQPRSDEHKVQWLSASGTPSYKELFLNLLHRSGSAWPQMDRSFFDADRLTQGGFSKRFYDALGLEPGDRVAAGLQANLAASLQQAIQDTVAPMIGPAESVCVAGGLALNALLIADLERRFPHVFVQPAAGNAGTALGAAFYAWHHFYHQERRIPFETMCLGPQFAPEQIKRVLENCKLHFRFLLTEGEVIEQALRSLGENKIVAWMHGRMEFGPRALGNRSILASPLNPYSTENLNVYIKHRESFRKFAASVPEEAVSEYFEVGPNARFLATVGRVKAKHRKQFAGAILGEDRIRVHTVRLEENPV